jgi:hypothetical protein
MLWRRLVCWSVVLAAGCVSEALFPAWRPTLRPGKVQARRQQRVNPVFQSHRVVVSVRINTASTERTANAFHASLPAHTGRACAWL